MKKIVTFLLALTLMIGVANGQTPVIFEGDGAVAGGTNNFDSLDGNWDHNNGSDEWDGSAIGAGRPGGVSALVEGPTDYIRIQDTGDPRDYGMGDPGSNRKLYFAHMIDFALDGAELDFRIRVPSEIPPLDPMHRDGNPGGAYPQAWPAGGDSYNGQHDGGKGTIGIRTAAEGQISFVPVLGAGPNGEDVLVMDDNQQGFIVGPAGSLNAWHAFDVSIAAGGTKSHQVSIIMDGNPAQVFDVQATGGNDYAGDYVAMAQGSTGEDGAVDIDYFYAVPEPMTLTLLGLGGLALIRRRK
jgi:hypothetical protein